LGPDIAIILYFLDSFCSRLSFHISKCDFRRRNRRMHNFVKMSRWQTVPLLLVNSVSTHQNHFKYGMLNRPIK